MSRRKQNYDLAPHVYKSTVKTYVLVVFSTLLDMEKRPRHSAKQYSMKTVSIRGLYATLSISNSQHERHSA